VSVDAGTASAHLTSVGSIKYVFDITPDSVVIDRLMAVYSKMDCSWGLYATDGQDLYDLFSAIVGKADVTVTVATWAGESFVFPFSLEAKDVSLDERTQIIKTSFGVGVDDGVTVGDVWADIVANHSAEIFEFHHSMGSGKVFDAIGTSRWMQSAMKLIFGLTATEFQSYPYDVIADPFRFNFVYDYVDPTDAANDQRRGYVCINVAGKNVDGQPANDIPAIQVLLSMAGHEGGVFGAGFNKAFYSNRAVDYATPVSVKFDDVIELGFQKNFTSFSSVALGTINKVMDGSPPHYPNLVTFTDTRQYNPTAEKAVSLRLNAGFPVMNAGLIEYSIPGVISDQITPVVSEALFVSHIPYRLAFPVEGALKINATLYGWGKVKPWELIEFDSTCPARYQGKTFRISDVTYDFIKAQTKITAYEVT
jgi:hypothetical protein